MNSYVNCRLWVMTCQCRFISCNQCTTGGGCWEWGRLCMLRGVCGSTWKISVPSLQFHWELKIYLRHKVFIKNNLNERRETQSLLIEVLLQLSWAQDSPKYLVLCKIWLSRSREKPTVLPLTSFGWCRCCWLSAEVIEHITLGFPDSSYVFQSLLQACAWQMPCIVSSQ